MYWLLGKRDVDFRLDYVLVKDSVPVIDDVAGGINQNVLCASGDAQ